jgi:hypothetical protein
MSVLFYICQDPSVHVKIPICLKIPLYTSRFFYVSQDSSFYSQDPSIYSKIILYIYTARSYICHEPYIYNTPRYFLYANVSQVASSGGFRPKFRLRFSHLLLACYRSRREIVDLHGLLVYLSHYQPQVELIIQEAQLYEGCRPCYPL